MRSECFSIEPFLYATEKRAADWSEQLEEPIRNCDAFVYMAGGTEGRTQRLEANWHFRLAETADRRRSSPAFPAGLFRIATTYVGRSTSCTPQ